MINARGYTAVIYCDGCQKELAEGPYPADAEDNLPPECFIISGEGEWASQHYCAQCHADRVQDTPSLPEKTLEEKLKSFYPEFFKHDDKLPNTGTFLKGCTKPNCDCIEQYELKHGEEPKYGYPCLHPDKAFIEEMKAPKLASLPKQEGEKNALAIERDAYRNMLADIYDELHGRGKICADIEQLFGEYPPEAAQDHIHVQLPTGAIDNVSPDASPELLGALDRMAELAMNMPEPSPKQEPENDQKINNQ